MVNIFLIIGFSMLGIFFIGLCLPSDMRGTTLNMIVWLLIMVINFALGIVWHKYKRGG